MSKLSENKINLHPPFLFLIKKKNSDYNPMLLNTKGVSIREVLLFVFETFRQSLV